MSYLQSSTDILNSFIEGKLQTKLSQNALDNLFGIVAASLSALKIVVEKNKKEALELIEKALSQVDQNSICRSVLKDLMSFIRANNEFVMIEENQEDWLCGETYTRILIITCFVPLIDPKTPLIHLEELELSKQRIVDEGMFSKVEKKTVNEEVPKIVKKRSKSNFVDKKTKNDYFSFEETPRKIQP